MPAFPDGTDVTFSLTPLPAGANGDASIENDFSTRPNEASVDPHCGQPSPLSSRSTHIQYPSSHEIPFSYPVARGTRPGQLHSSSGGRIACFLTRSGSFSFPCPIGRGQRALIEDMGYSTSTAFGTVGIDASFDVGWGVTIPFGYRFDNGFSLGASVGYYTAGLDTVSVSLSGDKLGELNLDADGTAVPILLNTSYSFQLSDALSFSLGAGAGVAWSEFALDQIGGVDVDASVDGWDFSFQGFSSLNYSVNQTTELSLGYRYIQTETDADSIQGHNVEAGVIVRF